MLLTMLFTVATAQDAVTLRFAPPVGTTAKYRLVNSMAQAMPGAPGGNTMKTTSEMSMRFVSRSGANTIVEVTTGATKYDVPANGPLAGMKKQLEAQAKAGGKIQMVMNAAGMPVSAKPVGQANAGSAAAMQGLVGGMQGIALPNRAVRVGESWKSSFDAANMMKAGMPSMPAGMKISGVLPITTKLAGVKKVGGKNLANLKFTMAGAMTMAMQGQNFVTKLKATGDYWIEVGTGVTQSVTTNSTSSTAFGAQSFDQKSKMTMTRL